MGHREYWTNIWGNTECKIEDPICVKHVGDVNMQVTANVKYLRFGSSKITQWITLAIPSTENEQICLKNMVSTST